MEKISRIVSSNARVASTDLKSAAAARPGMPSFGRPVGESTTANASSQTTAEKAVALHNEMLGRKKTGGDQVVQQMADAFFMTRVARPQEEVKGEGDATQVAATPEPDTSEISDIPATDDLVMAKADKSEEPDKKSERAYKPRGSYVDVRA